MRKKMKLNVDAPLFTQADMSLVSGLPPATIAKWLHRDILKPTRSGHTARGGHLFSVMSIFQAKVTGTLVKHLTIPPSEAAQVASLAAKGDWKLYVLRHSPRPPLSVFLLFTYEDDCWGYNVSYGPPEEGDLKKPVVAVLPAARDLLAVYEQCSQLLNAASRAEDNGGAQ
jgi:hypothetical protein